MKIMTFLIELERRFPPLGESRHSIHLAEQHGEVKLALSMNIKEGEALIFFEVEDIAKGVDDLLAEVSELIKRVPNPGNKS